LSSVQPQKYQLGFSVEHPETMYDEAARTMKARKVLSILEDYLGSLRSLRHLDIGCSTGFMTRLYSEQFASTTGIDIDSSAVEFARKNNKRPNVEFLVGDAMQTGLPAESFDVVTCSHIYEHVPDSGRLLEEIHRVLRPGGVCFFAAGNRFVLIEGHYNLPLLAAIPKPLGNLYVRLTGKADSYYEKHLSYWGIKRLVREFEVIDYTRKVIADPVRFSATDLIAPRSFKQKIALGLVEWAYWLCPTYLWILKKRSQ
jgi:ubiquinone/menaquinone biosynthesis C-methylase UbiE